MKITTYKVTVTKGLLTISDTVAVASDLSAEAEIQMAEDHFLDKWEELGFTDWDEVTTESC
jgi:hypothetical protein